MSYADTRCGHEMRTGACNMREGHRGRHTTVAWTCDGCDKSQRGQPAQCHPEAGSFCFMCVKQAREDYGY